MRKPILSLVLAALALGGTAATAQDQPPARPAELLSDRLIGTGWQARSLLGEAVADPAAATLEFLPGDQVRGEAGCNQFVGPFATRSERIVFGPLRVSLLRCEGAGASTQQQMLEALQKGGQVELQDDSLVLHATSGGESRFVPLPR
jgi:heat shock protein HslJ